MRSRVAVLVALGGFLGCLLCAATWMASMSCCAKTCEPCPVLLSKTAIAGSPDKTDALHALLPAAFALVVPTRVAIASPAFDRIPPFPAPGFRRPMRN